MLGGKMKKISNNKKGFTLVELLAVIVILALIMSIAVISMGGVMQSAREGTFKNMALSIIDGVKKQLTVNGQLAFNVELGKTTKTTYFFFEERMLEKGGDTSPLGGKITYAVINSAGTKACKVYAENFESCASTDQVTITKIGSMGLYKSATKPSCSATSSSYVVVKYYATLKKYTYGICLAAGSDNPYIAAYESDILNTKDNTEVIKGI